MNASAQNLIHLNCNGNLIVKFNKNTTNTTTNGSVTIDASNGSVLEGTIAEKIIKIPTFTSTATDTRFRGAINPKNITEKQQKELNIIYYLWYYSFDRYSGSYNVKLFYRAPPIKNGDTNWDEWDFEENGMCTVIEQKKF